MVTAGSSATGVEGTVGSSSGCEAVEGGGLGKLSLLAGSGLCDVGLLIMISGSFLGGFPGLGKCSGMGPT